MQDTHTHVPYLRIVAATTFNYGCSSVRLLNVGGSYSRAATINFVRARVSLRYWRYIISISAGAVPYVRMSVGQRPPNDVSMNIINMQQVVFEGGSYFLRSHYVRLLLEGGYYSMCGYYSNKYGTCICKPERKGPREYAKIGGLRETTRIIIACDSRKMLNMRFYTVIFAYFRGVYTRTRGIPRGFFAVNCA